MSLCKYVGVEARHVDSWVLNLAGWMEGVEGRREVDYCLRGKGCYNFGIVREGRKLLFG